MEKTVYKMSHSLYKYFLKRLEDFKSDPGIYYSGKTIFYKYPYTYIVGHNKRGVIRGKFAIEYGENDPDKWHGCEDLRDISQDKMTKAILSLSKKGYTFTGIVRVGKTPHELYYYQTLRRIETALGAYPLISFSNNSVLVATNKEYDEGHRAMYTHDLKIIS